MNKPFWHFVVCSKEKETGTRQGNQDESKYKWIEGKRDGLVRRETKTDECAQIAQITNEVVELQQERAEILSELQFSQALLGFMNETKVGKDSD